MKVKQSKITAVEEANTLLNAINIRQERIDILFEAAKEAERQTKYADNRQIIKELLTKISDDNEVEEILCAVIRSINSKLIATYNREINQYTKQFNKLKIQ